jgi:diguanylate cyclase (GGDEF)-like protein/PAS domain S-box-containing protein
VNPAATESPMNRPATPEPDERAPATGFWQSVRAAHFKDYNRAAFSMWLAIVVAGTAAGTGAVGALFGPSAPDIVETVVALLMVAAAAWLPVAIPRSRYSVGAGDAFIFTVLAVLGPSAAVLAAGVESGVGACRSTPRLTSRISNPMAAMASMALCGALFQASWTTLSGLGLSPVVSRLAVLPSIALVMFVLTSVSLMSTVTLKRGHWPDILAWFADSTWMAALYVASALLAGVVQLASAEHGSIAAGIIGVATLVVALLLSRSFSRSELEHRAQEERIRAAQRESELNHQRFVGAFENAAVGMAIVDADGKVVRANHALSVLLQRGASELAGAPFTAMLHAGDLGRFERHRCEVALREGDAAASVELRCCAADGAERWVALHCGRFSDPDGLVDGLIYQLHDVTSRRVAEQRLQHIAYHDSLTDLANRAAFQDTVSRAVEASRNEPAAQFAVMFLDLDRFKVVNDSLGHLAGNELLREVGRRLTLDLRQNDLVARLGGDEFAVLLQDVRDKESCIRLAERMLGEVSRPFFIKGHELIPVASAGITFSDLGYRTVDELLRDADLAMYEAKASSPTRIAVFDRSMHARIADKLALETDLRHAIVSDGLSLAFQPLFDLDPHRLTGFEALARWTHPSRGVISPTVFIEIAEEAGHIVAVTTWVLDKALSQLADWHRSAPHMTHLGVQVNITGRDLAQPRFAERVLELLRLRGVAPELLTLEITESVLMNQIERAGEVLARVRAGGVHVAIDDFGTGYSSLSYLSKLPVDSLKIDRSFVSAMGSAGDGVEIVRAVTNLGRALGKKIVAEGIETAEQLAVLRRLGVDGGQGYLLARPLWPEQVPALLFAPAACAVTPV